jgi:hypothetical protein
VGDRERENDPLLFTDFGRVGRENPVSNKSSRVVIHTVGKRRRYIGRKSFFPQLV